MKRISKFYDDHKDEVIAGLGGLLAATAGVALLMLKQNMELQGKQVCCGGMREGSNDTIFDVYLMNDHVIEFKRPFVAKPDISQVLHLS